MGHKMPPELTRRPNRGVISVLPAEGPNEKVPLWPLDKMRKGEQGLWRSVWKLPQAYAWHHLRYTRVVARYCRLVLRAEDAGNDGSGVTYQAEVRRLETELGLTPRSMHMLNWRIVDSKPEESAISDLEAYRQAVGQESD